MCLDNIPIIILKAPPEPKIEVFGYSFIAPILVIPKITSQSNQCHKGYLIDITALEGPVKAINLVSLKPASFDHSLKSDTEKSKP
jgi:hypothetical protein